MADIHKPEHALTERLLKKQSAAISQTESNLETWRSIHENYGHLKERLTELPEQVDYSIMVPLGKLAFMPGTLMHTNEITVLLGDNWFVKRSAKQAADIVGRRMNSINKKIEQFDAQLDLLKTEQDYTKKFSEQSNDEVEIREPYDEERERIWRLQHAENVKKYRRSTAVSKTNVKSQSETNSFKTEDICDRLEETTVGTEPTDQLQSNIKSILKSTHPDSRTIKFRHSDVKPSKSASADPPNNLGYSAPGDILFFQKSCSVNKDVVAQTAFADSITEHNSVLPDPCVSITNSSKSSSRPVSKFKMSRQK